LDLKLKGRAEGKFPPTSPDIYNCTEPNKRMSIFLEMTDLSVARRCCFRKQFNVPRLPHTDTPWSLALGEQVTFHAFHSLILCTGPSLSFPSFGYYKFFHSDPHSIVLGGKKSINTHFPSTWP